MRAWRVLRPHSNGRVWVEDEETGEETQCREIDTVFYDDNCDEWYVRHTLINHDGYPANIIVVPEK